MHSWGLGGELKPFFYFKLDFFKKLLKKKMLFYETSLYKIIDDDYQNKTNYHLKSVTLKFKGCGITINDRLTSVSSDN